MADIAAERGTAPFDTLLDIVLADDLRTVLWPNTDDGDEATWEMRGRDLERPARHGRRLRRRRAPRPHVRLELPDRSSSATACAGRKLVPVEKAVHMLTAQPAQLFGLRDRGLVREGYVADLVRVRSRDGRLRAGPPGPRPARWTPLASTPARTGSSRVLVNGVETIRDGAPTGALPGALLRSGRDTASVIPPRPEPRAPASPSSLPPVTPDPNDPVAGRRGATCAGPPGVDRDQPDVPADSPSPTRWIKEAVVVVVVAVLVAVLLRAFVVQTFFIPSGSMEPTLQIGDRILVNKLSYDLHGVDRGDIVVFSRPPTENCGGPEVNDLVKRVIGLPGDVISLTNGYVYVDGKQPRRVAGSPPPSRASPWPGRPATARTWPVPTGSRPTTTS